MSHEAYFHVSTDVNGQRFQYFCQECSSEMLESPLRFFKVRVRLCAASFTVITPRIFETEQHETGTWNTRYYRNMLEKIHPYKMRHLGVRKLHVVLGKRLPYCIQLNFHGYPEDLS